MPKLQTAHFTIAGNIVFAEAAETMNISKSEVDTLHNIVANNISGKFGLIETRPKNISIDPMVYRYAKELMPQFTAYALVTQSDLTLKFFKFEEAFIKDIRYAVFHTLAEAEFWMQAVLADEDKS